jgi:hypothetical protein
VSIFSCNNWNGYVKAPLYNHQIAQRNVHAYLGEVREDDADVEHWSRLAVTQVADGPREDPQQRQAVPGRLLEVVHQRRQSASTQNEIARRRAFTGQIAQHPHRLLQHLQA